jgi:hypothetical protein
MSTKTLRKRIALATVVALGAGVLSLVSTATANAAANVAAGTDATAAATYGVLNIGTGTSLTGTAQLDNASVANNRSMGLVNVSDIAGGLIAQTTQTATLLSTGVLSVYTTGNATATSALSIVVTGGRITANSGFNAAYSTLSASATALTTSGIPTGQPNLLAAAITPNTGVTLMTVQLFNATSTTGAAQAAAPTSGSLVGQITVTIGATSSAGVVSLTKSGVYYTSAYNAAATTSDTSSLVTGGIAVGTANYNSIQYAQVRVRDAFANSVTLTNGLLQATATNGAYVKIYPGSTTAVGTSSTDFTTSGQDGYNIAVSNPTTAPITTTLTVSYNGTVIGTKTFNFLGEVAKIVLSSPANGKISNTTSNTASMAVYDAAGNSLYFTLGGTASTAIPGANLSSTAAPVTDIASALSTNPDITSGVVTGGAVKFTCGSTAGNKNIGVTFTNNSGTVVNSNVLNVSCSDKASTYTATLDKSTYVPGDIATLTFTFKDSKGNLANDVDAVSSSGKLITWSGSQISTAVTGYTQATGYPYDYTTNGVIKLKFIVGSTTGSYTGIADVPALDSTTTPQNAITIAYKVADGSTSLNDVLKGIVDLIASINKQIAALAKLVTKKK